MGLPGDIDGMVHLSDLSWDNAGDEAIRDFKKGDQVKVKVLDVDMDKERISLGIKQLANDPFEKVGSVAKKGDVVTVIVAGIQDNGIDVTVQDGIPGFIRKSELSRDRSEQRPDRYAIGDKLDAKITNIDKASRRVVLSVKARELDEEKKAMADFGSSDSAPAWAISWAPCARRPRRNSFLTAKPGFSAPARRMVARSPNLLSDQSLNRCLKPPAVAIMVIAGKAGGFRMIKSELIAKLAEAENPALLLQKDVERVVGVILDRVTEAMVEGRIASNCAASAPSGLVSAAGAGRAQSAHEAPRSRSSAWQPCPSSKAARNCASASTRPETPEPPSPRSAHVGGSGEFGLHRPRQRRRPRGWRHHQGRPSARSSPASSSR